MVTCVYQSAEERQMPKKEQNSPLKKIYDFTTHHFLWQNLHTGQYKLLNMPSFNTHSVELANSKF